MTNSYVDDPFPSLLRVVVPDVHEVYAEDTRVIIPSIEFWSHQFVVHMVVPHLPDDDEPQLKWTTDWCVSDNLNTRYRPSRFSSSGQGPGGTTTYAVGAYRPFDPRATEVHIPWGDDHWLIIPGMPVD